MAIKSRPSFNSYNPVNDAVIGTYPIMNKSEVRDAVHHARIASARWHSLGFSGRKKVLLAWSSLMINRIDQIADLISLETGKPPSDARLELSIAVSHIGWAARHAESIMRTSFRRPGLLMANMSATLERAPMGVIGVIGPWNYPIFTPVGSIAYALAAGNTVVFKPSQYSPGIGIWLEEIFNEVAPFADILTTITGPGETGEALCLAGVDKLSFTGSTRTAKLVAAQCATVMVPVVLECGGKDPVIVAADADVKRAVDATIWSAMANAGQSCIAAERVYVDEKVADEFIVRAIELAATIHAGPPGDGEYGPATMPSQVKVIQSHIKTAIADGGTCVYGGPTSVKTPFVQPVILIDVPESSVAMREESFGPIIIINPVATMNEAIERSNASAYGLGASVWSKRKGRKIASQLQCGMVAINSTFSFATIASLPFGGVKDSGSGRVHGPEGLLEYTFARTVVRTRFYLPLHLLSFKRRPQDDRLVIKLTKLLKGRLG
ncbi:MAG: aldehyde dehydrogenase family protein [Actinomycetota bacterium]|nr:aldehyde dehydrogenase family protein [Actinomycetota bacterium]